MEAEREIICQNPNVHLEINNFLCENLQQYKNTPFIGANVCFQNFMVFLFLST